MNFNSIEIGDMIAISRVGYKHVGIYVGPRQFDGSCVVHNCKRKGVILSTLSDFSDNSQIFIHKKATGNFQEREMIAQRALSLLGTKYDLFQFNCEHAATKAQSGIAQSPQIGAVALLTLFVTALALFAGSRKA